MALLNKLRSNSLVRIVSDDKTVKGKFLNLCGVQLIRAVAARAIYNLRTVTIPYTVVKMVNELKREGIVVLPDFLPQDHFELVQQEALALMEQNREKAELHKRGPNTVYHLSLPIQCERHKTQVIQQFLDDVRIRAILEAAEKRSLGHLLGKIEHLHQGIRAGHDPETELHSDIFFHTHKAWLYLSDVEDDCGPLVYVKRSHHLRPAQLLHAYKESCSRNGGSRRISLEEFERLGLEETVVSCRKNTLVVANTCGYHRRLKGEPGRDRYAVHVILRFNPFTLWLYSRPTAIYSLRASN
jgi:hypothetical protein